MALYLSVASGDATIRRVIRVFELDSNCACVSMPTSLVMALAGGLIMTIQIVFVDDALSIGKSILRLTLASAQAAEN